jgi:hypothetical protein
LFGYKKKRRGQLQVPKNLSFRENSRSFYVWFLKYKTPLKNPPLKDIEKLQQKSSLDILWRSSVHVYLEDHQGSIIGVLFCSWVVYKLHTTTPLIFTLYSFSRFSIIDYSLCLLLTNFLIAAKVEHNSSDSKAINKIFFHVHAGKHSLLNSFICLPIHMMMTIICLFTCKWFNKRTRTFKINSMVNHVFVHWNICFWPSFILEDKF